MLIWAEGDLEAPRRNNLWVRRVPIQKSLSLSWKNARFWSYQTTPHPHSRQFVLILTTLLSIPKATTTSPGLGTPALDLFPFWNLNSSTTHGLFLIDVTPANFYLSSMTGLIWPLSVHATGQCVSLLFLNHHDLMHYSYWSSGDPCLDYTTST